MKMSEIPGTVRCILCQAVISFRQNDKSKFQLHLQLEHMVNADTDIILAVCLMDEEEVQAVKNVMFTKLQNSSEDSEENLEDAQVQTAAAEVFSCENCKKIFKSKKSLRQHVQRRICSNTDNTVALEVDGVNSETEIETLVKTEPSVENVTLEENPLVSPVEAEVISCVNCKTIFKTKKIMRRHLAQRICLNKVTNSAMPESSEDVIDDEEKETVKEVTDEDLANSEYFSDQKRPVITRISSQAAMEEYNEEEMFLPGWRIKTLEVFTDSQKSGVSKRRRFLTPNRKWRIQTSLGVLEYLRLQGRKESELSSLAEQLGVDRRRFMKLFSLNVKQEAESLSPLTDEDIAKSKYLSHGERLRRVMKVSISEFSEEDRMLPGWRIKTRLLRDHRSSGRKYRKLKTFLTPGKKRSITTSTGVLEYLRLQGKQKEELTQVAQHLGVDKTKFYNLYD